MDEIKFTFVTEQGTRTLTYEEYLSDAEIKGMIGDKRRKFLNLGLVIISYDRIWYSQHNAARKDFDLVEKEQQLNPIRFYLPCCARSGFNSPAHQYINDDIHEVTGMISGNRGGKTTSMIVKMCVTRGIVPCDPKWEIFTDHGIKYHEWTTPKNVGICSYNWDNHRKTIWPQIIQAWLPAEQLGPYAKGGKKWPNFSGGSPVVPLKCLSAISMNCYDQPQGIFESEAKNGWAWDEQGTESKFDAADLRTSTLRWWWEDAQNQQHVGDGFHEFSLTPHRVEDRPDETGAGTYIHRMATGEDTKGLEAKFYTHNLINDTPDWVYAEKEKASKIETWITIPKRQGNLKRLREGESRMFGHWHESSGLVYDDWSRAIHMIDPFPIPAEWTKFRAYDHGRKHPFVCLWAVVSPDGDCYLYREYRDVGRDVSDYVREVVKRSGNILRRYTEAIDPVMMMAGVVPMREVQCAERYLQTVMDPRAFSKPQDHTSLTLGQLYVKAGIRASGGSGMMNEKAIPLVAEWLRVDDSRFHISTGERGAPRFYVFNTLTHFPKAIERYVYKHSKIQNERVKQEDDDEMDAFKYLMQIPPRYVKGFSAQLEENDGKQLHQQRRRLDSITAY